MILPHDDLQFFLKLQVIWGHETVHIIEADRHFNMALVSI